VQKSLYWNRYKRLIVKAALVLCFVTSCSHAFNQNAFEKVFGFYLIGNFYSLKASTFGCLDCDELYIKFTPSASVLQKILKDKNCTFETYNSSLTSDAYFQSLISQSPDFWHKCEQGKSCAYGNGGLWYNEQTGLMCYAHIILW
jgi:hypothetical protein